jgi:tetratricopeptide (TPR) repeat protein
MAQDSAAGPSWDACLKAPTRACILDEALADALAVESSDARASLLGRVVQALATAGNLQSAFQAAQSIPPDRTMPRLTALQSIANAQIRLGLPRDARETLIQARRLADTLTGQLSRAETLYAIGQLEAEAGMATEAAGAFQESLRLAESLEIPAGGNPCQVFPSTEGQLDQLLKRLAQQQATTGNISDSLRTARLIRYEPRVRAEALRLIAGTQAQIGLKDEAAPTLREALEAAHAAQTPPERWPSCPMNRHLGSSGATYVGMLCDVFKAQAKAGLIEDASATLEEAFQYIADLKDDPLVKTDTSGVFSFLKVDVARINAWAAVAEAQHDAGLKTQSAATFERATQAAADLTETKSRIATFTLLGRAQFKAGRIPEAVRALDGALESARALDDNAERVSELLRVLEIRAEAGLDADAASAQALEAARSVADGSRRTSYLHRLALVQVKMGRREEAVATYREALDGADAIADERSRSFTLNLMLRGMAGNPAQARLIAGSAPQAARLAHSMEGRVHALVLVANALPD